MKSNFVRSGIHKDSSMFLLLSNGRDIAVKRFKSILKPQINEGSMSRNLGSGFFKIKFFYFFASSTEVLKFPLIVKYFFLY